MWAIPWPMMGRLEVPSLTVGQRKEACYRCPYNYLYKFIRIMYSDNFQGVDVITK